MKLSFFSALVAASTAAAQVALHPNTANNKCLDVGGNVQDSGTPVQIFDCNNSAAQMWWVNPGKTTVRLANTNYCLDAGSSPGPNTPTRIWDCINNLPAQTWYLTLDNRIALLDTGLCLDLPNGNLTNTNVVQTFNCTSGNTNQIWQQ